MGLLEHFGPTVGKLRVARNLSQEKLAHLSGLHATTISEVERGKTGVSLETLEALARGLGITPDNLLRIVRTGEPWSDAPDYGDPGRPADYGAGSRQLRFSIVAERTSAGYTAYCPDLPGCAATGRSRADVERAMREAITAELQSRRQAGNPIPEPASYSAVVSVII